MGIAHHSSYVLWMEVGRTEFMRAYGFSYRQLEELGVIMPVLEINVRYRQPAVYDDELRITTWVDELTRVRIKLAYTITRIIDGALMVEAHSFHTFAGPDGRPIRITHHPEAWERIQRMAPTNATQD
jgi:acyl-CoA thioester hydrolase